MPSKVPLPVLTAHQQPSNCLHQLLLRDKRTVSRQPVPPLLGMVLLRWRQQPLLLQPLLLLLLLQLCLLL